MRGKDMYMQNCRTGALDQTKHTGWMRTQASEHISPAVCQRLALFKRDICRQRILQSNSEVRPQTDEGNRLPHAAALHAMTGACHQSPSQH